MTKRELIEKLSPFDDNIRVVIHDVAMHFDIFEVVQITGGVSLVADLVPVDEPEGGLQPERRRNGNENSNFFG